jgi:hypothetical protein
MWFSHGAMHNTYIPTQFVVPSSTRIFRPFNRRYFVHLMRRQCALSQDRMLLSEADGGGQLSGRLRGADPSANEMHLIELPLRARPPPAARDGVKTHHRRTSIDRVFKVSRSPGQKGIQSVLLRNGAYSNGRRSC